MFKSILVPFLMLSIFALTHCTSRNIDEDAEMEISEVVGETEGEQEEGWSEEDDEVDSDFAEDDEVDSDFAEDDEIDSDFAEDDEIDSDFAEGDEIDSDFAEDDEIDSDFAEGDGEEDVESESSEDIEANGKTEIADGDSSEEAFLDEYGGEDVVDNENLDGIEGVGDVAQEETLSEGGEDASVATLDIGKPIDEVSQMSEEGGVFPLEGQSDDEDWGEMIEEPEVFLQKKRSWVPVKKVVEVPFYKRGILINGVYLARPGDDLASISTKIYGTKDRSDELLKVNSTLVRGLKTGDKVYYNSPQRPNDSNRLMLYYEDMNAVPQIYISKEGDNIRSISKSLLGDKGSWKEIWATNFHVDSKDQIPAGTELRYWLETDMTQVVSSDPVEMIPEAQFEEEILPPPPPVAANTLPPPPPFPEAGDVAESTSMPEEPAVTESLNPPPIPETSKMQRQTANNDTLVLPPPVPEAPSGFKKPSPQASSLATVPSKGEIASTTESSDDKIVWIGGGALLLFGMILTFSIIRKRRAANQNLDFNTVIGATTEVDMPGLTDNKPPAV